MATSGSARLTHLPPRVALPMLTLVPGGMGGSETYARELCRELARREDVQAFSVVSRAGEGFSPGIPERVQPRVRGGGSPRERVRTLAQAAASRRSSRSLIRQADVVHFPFSVPVPRPPRGTPFVQTLLDVQHRDLPDLFSPAERVYRSLLYDRAARRASAVVTISDFSKRQIVDQLGVDPDRVHVAHLGVDPSDFTPNLGPREDFVLYPARGWPHKNHERLIEAFTKVRSRRPDLRLVLTGGGLETIRDVPSWVDIRGLVSHAELLELYRRASCLVFPSLYEGFGLPPLEAMASGCPVAAADAGSLPEVCGDAAVLFDATDPSAIADGIERALVVAPELVARGIDRVHRFSWRACADVHVRVYESVADMSGGRRRG